MAPRPKPPPARPKERPPIKAPPPTLVRQAAAGAAARAKAAALPRPKIACPNKECAAPDIQDGICHNCGFIVDDSNIVSEVQFGENSSGAAVVQGSFVSADQGGARSVGPAFQRSGGGEDRESTIREGRRIIQALGTQLGVSEPTIQSGIQIFKLAAMNNFIQGRRMDMVCCVCLYSACRKETPCRIMLIDFADKVQVNVFKLGHTFKCLHEAIAISRAGIQPVLPEDLIFRFAKQLEFGPLMTKVAEDAVRMVQRMSYDWMVMGRRPSGVCGACLILAARMNNFRRTITEVVYIVKVTTHTIQKRLEEFKQTPSSSLTVEEFLNNEFLEVAHDPPSFYEKTEDFQKTKKRRKRKGHDALDDDNSGSDNGESESVTPGPNKRQKTANLENASAESPSIAESSSNTQASSSSGTTSTPETPTSPEKPFELRRDADGFAIPPQPTQSHDIPIDPNLIDQQIEEQAGTTLQKLAADYGDSLILEDDDDAEEPAIPQTPQPKAKRGARAVMVPEAWSNEEQELEDQINELISDPNTVAHAISYAKAKERVATHMLAAEESSLSREVNMDVHIGEDEFEDDIEVQNCLLSAADAARKEKVWVNENKEWLRKQQMKMWAKKNAENGPPKATRNRKRKPRIGEGQTSAASSPGEAAIAALKQRSFSKKINYDAINSMFGALNRLQDKDALGSAATSRITSRAGSEATESDTESIASSAAASIAHGSIVSGSDAGSVMDVNEDIPLIAPFPTAKPRRRAPYKPKPKQPKLKAKPVPEPEEDDEDGDDDDYIKPTDAPVDEEEDPADDWKSSLKKTHATGADEDEYEDNEDYEDLGGIEAGGFADDDDTAFGDNTGYGDDEDDYGGDDYE